MRNACEELFAARSPIPGLAAVAVRMPDGTLSHQCFERWVSPAQARQALGRLAQERETLAGFEIEPARTTWLFEHLRIEVIHRSDKACLAMFLANRSDLALETVEATLQDFANLVLDKETETFLG